ncbi:PEP-CTERM sorting domain-containing protein [Puniceicoccales bacterium CK1056]|uniref:PEP-CTERM sorting domain-containing protein n=1 Tax=Oceanipulchritudo coccoides TaxID=2706888 RepID=A0A6B2M0R2_9BACT|nr:PEP-CTERM sorting domain-containing protein [Oceanipulchritudo coccoides]NDV61909.1 PEP-CTERM sorting domain-containing protein [Oceanipulchritudo coccoides]
MASLAGLVTSSLSAQLNFTVDPGAAWNGFVNTFSVADDSFQFGFGYGDFPNAQSTFSGSTLSLGANKGIYDVEAANPVWVNQTTGDPELYIEYAFYQEVVGAAIGTTVNFDFETITQGLPAGYSVVAFAAVLDGFVTWATTQLETAPLVSGVTDSLSLVVASPGTGTPVVQAGFRVTGPIQPSLDEFFNPNPLTLQYATVQTPVPEPSTYAVLLGFAALGLVIYRRRKA